GVRKRVGVFRRLGGYDGWRITHLAIGAACAVALFAHTGFRFGDNLTMALMAAFVATLAFGAAAGLATGGEHKLRESGVGSAERPPRAAPLWLHVLALWPLPALLFAHILSVYVY
ncbi:MAG: NAD(P)/FAD-dependent oxidoreductase, partial [Pseudomonadota bacterium]